MDASVARRAHDDRLLATGAPSGGTRRVARKWSTRTAGKVTTDQPSGEGKSSPRSGALNNRGVADRSRQEGAATAWIARFADRYLSLNP
jgi:hypothetical protein